MPINLTLRIPTNWSEVTRRQLIILGESFWQWPLQDDQLGRLLMRLNQFSRGQAQRWNRATSQARYQPQLQEGVYLALERASFFRWVHEDLCYDAPKLHYLALPRAKWQGPSKGLRSMTYEQFFDAADPLCNAYLQDRHPRVLANLCAALYMPTGETYQDNAAAERRAKLILDRLPQAVQHAALYDFLAMRRWLFERTAFKALSEQEDKLKADTDQEPDDARMRAAAPPPFNDVVFALAKEDVTKIEAVKKQPLWTVLEAIISQMNQAQRQKEASSFQ